MAVKLDYATVVFAKFPIDTAKFVANGSENDFDANTFPD